MEKKKKLLEFPLISNTNRALNDNIRSAIIKNRQINSLMIPVNRSMISNYDRGGLLRNFIFSSKRS